MARHREIRRRLPDFPRRTFVPACCCLRCSGRHPDPTSGLCGTDRLPRRVAAMAVRLRAGRSLARHPRLHGPREGLRRDGTPTTFGSLLRGRGLLGGVRAGRASTWSASITGRRRTTRSRSCKGMRWCTSRSTATLFRRDPCEPTMSGVQPSSAHPWGQQEGLPGPIARNSGCFGGDRADRGDRERAGVSDGRGRPSCAGRCRPAVAATACSSGSFPDPRAGGAVSVTVGAILTVLAIASR